MRNIKKLQLLICLLFISFYSYSQINFYQTGIINSKEFKDSISFNGNDKFIVLPLMIDGICKKLIFDTGSDFTIFKNNTSKSIGKSITTDSNGNISEYSISSIKSLKINDRKVRNLFSLDIELPKPFLCFGEGLIGTSFIRSCNWLIRHDMIEFSNMPFYLTNSISLNTFYIKTNSLYANAIINDLHIDTCLIDYGGFFEIQLPVEYYLKNKESFKSNSQYFKIVTQYGANGKSKPDTILHMNCNVNFNGIIIDSVSIDFKSKVQNRIGIRFLKRFNNVAINNVENKILLNGLYKKEKQKHEILYSFDLINGFFEIDTKIITNDSIHLNIGDMFTEINSMKASDFADYCDFLNWEESLDNFEYLDLKSFDNRKIRIKNWR